MSRPLNLSFKVQRTFLWSTLGLAALTSGLIICQNYIERLREIRLYSDEISLNMESHIASLSHSGPSTHDLGHGSTSHNAVVINSGLNEHLKTYLSLLDANSAEFGRTSSVFLLSRSGDILLSSVNQWQGLNIKQGMVLNHNKQNHLVQSLLRCVESPRDCSSRSIPTINFWGDIISTVNIIKKRSFSSGSPFNSDTILLVNYDKSVLLEGFDTDILITIVFSLFFSILAYFFPYFKVKKSVLNRIEDIEKQDSITNLLNFSSFRELAVSFLAEKELQQQSCVLFLISLKEFRRFNELYGFSMGDMLLAKISSALVYSFSIEDSLLCRVQGDLFAVLAPNNTLSGDIRFFSERLQLLIEKDVSNSSNTDEDYKIKISAVSTDKAGYAFEYLLNKAQKDLLTANSANISESIVDGAML